MKDKMSLIPKTHLLLFFGAESGHLLPVHLRCLFARGSFLLVGHVALSSSLFPSPSYIVVEGSARSSGNACSWGVSTALLGVDLYSPDSPSRLTIESLAHPTVCVGLFGDLVLIAGENVPPHPSQL